MMMMDTIAAPLHIDSVHHYIDDFEYFYDDYVMDEKLALQLFTNGLREEVQKNVVMFNPLTLRDAYSLAKLAKAIVAYPQPIMIHDDIHVELVDPVVECEDLPLTYISIDDVELMDLVVECEDLPLTYLSIDGVELMEPIKEYEALPPSCIYTDDVASKCLIPLEQVVECEDLPLTYITMDDFGSHVLFKHPLQDYSMQQKQLGGFFMDSSR